MIHAAVERCRFGDVLVVTTTSPSTDGAFGELLAMALGTVKATPGAVNVPVSIAGQQVLPGDAVLADDDGVVVVPRPAVSGGLAAAQARADKGRASRDAFRRGELGPDGYGLRSVLSGLDVTYVDYHGYQEPGP